jgi:hypothetical protein
MRAMLLPLVLLLAASTAPGPPAGEAAEAERAASFRARIVLRARIESAQPPDARRLADVAAEVRAIWQPYVDVELAWPGDVVARGLDDQLELVITDRLPENGSPQALGWIEFVSPLRPVRSLSVSVPSARRLAGQVPWGMRAHLGQGEMRERFVARALARGIAHELGHYLLAMRGHGKDGLMRPHFDVGDMLKTGYRHLGLDPSQTALLRERLLEYQVARRISEDPALLQ